MIKLILGPTLGIIIFIGLIELIGWVQKLEEKKETAESWGKKANLRLYNKLKPLMKHDKNI